MTEPQSLKLPDSFPNSMTAELPDYLVAGSNAQPNSIVFKSGTIPKEIIRLDSKGFYYRGQLIEDAGEAHRLFVEFMRQSNQTHHINQPTNKGDFND